MRSSRVLQHLVSGGILMSTMACSTPADLSQALPEEIHGWKADEPDGLYDAGSLHEYIDGAAEVYLALNVESVLGRRYAKEGYPEIIADLFRMGSTEDAFGAFHHDLREGSSAGIGRESEYASGALAFWMGRCFVSIMALGETAETRAAVLELGRAIASKLPEEGGPPDLLRYLPEENLLPGQIHYFHTHGALNRYHYLDERNILALDERTEGLLARYRSGLPDEESPGTHALLVIRYAAPGDARSAERAFRREILAGSGGEGVGRAGGGEWAGARAHDRVLVSVLEAPVQAIAEATMEKALRRVRDGR